jgi:hypothetical protein
MGGAADTVGVSGKTNAIAGTSPSASLRRDSDFRVSYAETLSIESTARSGQQKSAASSDARITAFGRRFDFSLENNDRLLRKAPLSARQQLTGVSALKGELKDVPGSWVRLTVRNGAYEGAIWDGTELYLIEPRETIELALLSPSQDKTARSFIYRLSDTQGGLTQKSCAVEGSAQPVSNPAARYRSLISELKTFAAAALASAPREIEVSMVGDYEYANQQGPNALGTMVSWMNVVDGIFSSQVGVSVVPTDFTFYVADNDPFSGSSPETLLDQVSTYRGSSAEVSSRGLTHLLTGRDLDGNTVGIAFLGSLCDAHAGVSLSQGSFNMDTALIIAHELGHNFGAPHDAESGSSCVTTPAAYLMAPGLNGSSTFSGCSLQKMQPYIAAASCIVNARIRDVAVTVPAASIQAVLNESFDYIVDVTSVGQAAAANIVVSVNLPGSFVIESANLNGTACPVAGTAVNCQLSQLAMGESRRLILTAHPTSFGTFASAAQVSSTNDSDSSNNNLPVSINVANDRDLRIDVTPQPLTFVKDQGIDLDVEIASVGTLAVAGVRTTISLFATIQQASVPGGSCVISSSQIACDLGSIAASESRHIHVKATPFAVGNLGMNVQAYTTGTPAISKYENFPITVTAARDVSASITPANRIAAIGTELPYSLELKSNGTQSVDAVKVHFVAPLFSLVFEGPLASSCVPVSFAFDCTIGSMPAGSAITIPFHISSAQPTFGSIIAQVESQPADDDPSNNSGRSDLYVRNAVDVLVDMPSSQRSYDQREAATSFRVRSLGANAADNVTATLSFPQGSTVEFVGSSAAANCAVQTIVLNCAIPHIDPDTAVTVDLKYSIPAPGVYSGSASVMAPGDADATNNVQALTFTVSPAIDGRLDAPVVSRAFTNQPVDLIFNVSSNRYALADARLLISWFAELSDISATSPLGNCVANGSSLACDLGTLAPDTAVPVTLRFRGATVTYVSMSAHLQAADDSDATNNGKLLSFRVYNPGDLSVTAANTTASAQSTQTLELSGINVVASAEMIDPFFSIDVDPARASGVVATIGSTICSPTPPQYRCTLALQAAGTQVLKINMTVNGEGALPVKLKVGAANDVDDSNNEMLINVTVQAAPAPPVTPPTTPPGGSGNPGGGGSSSSGGGGAVDPLAVMALGCLLAASVRRRAKSRWNLTVASGGGSNAN